MKMKNFIASMAAMVTAMASMVMFSGEAQAATQSHSKGPLTPAKYEAYLKNMNTVQANEILVKFKALTPQEKREFIQNLSNPHPQFKMVKSTRKQNSISPSVVSGGSGGTYTITYDYTKYDLGIPTQKYEETATFTENSSYTQIAYIDSYNARVVFNYNPEVTIVLWDKHVFLAYSDTQVFVTAKFEYITSIPDFLPFIAWKYMELHGGWSSGLWKYGYIGNSPDSVPSNVYF